MSSVQPFTWSFAFTLFNFYFFICTSTNPTLMVFDKSVMDTNTVTWCKWKSFILGFFIEPFHFKIKLTWMHKITHVWEHVRWMTYSTFKYSMVTIGFDWNISLALEYTKSNMFEVNVYSIIDSKVFGVTIDVNFLLAIVE